jgi:hypothetical protein
MVNRGRSDNRWHTSSRSDSGECVEVATNHDEVLVRDSKQRSGPVLRFTAPDWARFVRHVSGDKAPEP